MIFDPEIMDFGARRQTGNREPVGVGGKGVVTFPVDKGRTAGAARSGAGGGGKAPLIATGNWAAARSRDACCASD